MCASVVFFYYLDLNNDSIWITRNERRFKVCLRFTIYDFTIHDLRFTIYDLLFPIPYSRFTITDELSIKNEVTTSMLWRFVWG